MRLILILLFPTLCFAQNNLLPYYDSAWSKSYEPFRIAGNLYYVGTYDLACYLVATPDGHVLINTGLAGSVDGIRQNVMTLGFQFEDIKILLTTQAHYDHVAGMAEIKKATGAKMLVHERDGQVLQDGGRSDFALKNVSGSFFDPVQPDRLLKDGEIITIGTTAIKILHHPGHTKGASSFLITVQDESRPWTVLVANMPSILTQTRISGMPSYPEVGRDYKYTLEAMKNIDFDIWVASHASQFKLHEKRKPGDPYNPAIFSDRPLYEASINSLKGEYDRRIKSE